ncbi:DUF6676 family protein [Stomatohabitans albus]|uniref:Rv1476 family membrane protein n=1 Tax=Stomatohabitans albus TaxID=3110766 RepID=UPI00300CBFDF
MSHHGNVLRNACLYALAIGLCAVPSLALAQDPSSAPAVPGQSLESSPEATQPISPSTPPTPGQPSPESGSALPAPGADGTAPLIASIIAAMDGGPRIWSSPEATIPDFAAINAALESPEATKLDLRVAIWGADKPGVNAEDVAYGIGQAINGTVIAIGPDAVGVYSATHSDEALTAALEPVTAQLAGESNPAVVVSTVAMALTSAQPAQGSLYVPLLIGLAVLVIGGGLWVVFGRKRMTGIGVTINRLLAGRTSDDEERSPSSSQAYEAEPAAAHTPPGGLADDQIPQSASIRRVAAEVIDIEPEGQTAKRSTSSAQRYGTVAQQQRLSLLGQQIVALSEVVARSEDMESMVAFELVASGYQETKEALAHVSRPIDLLDLDERITALSEQLVVLERRMST